MASPIGVPYGEQSNIARGYHSKVYVYGLSNFLKAFIVSIDTLLDQRSIARTALSRSWCYALDLHLVRSSHCTASLTETYKANHSKANRPCEFCCREDMLER